MTAIRELARQKKISRRTVRRLIECGWSDEKIAKEAVPGKRYKTSSGRSKKTNRERIKELIIRLEQIHKKSLEEMLSRLFNQFTFKEVAQALSISQQDLRKIILFSAKKYRDRILF